jgi:hypothetical protein
LLEQYTFGHFVKTQFLVVAVFFSLLVKRSRCELLTFGVNTKGRALMFDAPAAVSSMRAHEKTRFLALRENSIRFS